MSFAVFMLRENAVSDGSAIAVVVLPVAVVGWAGAFGNDAVLVADIDQARVVAVEAAIAEIEVG